MIIELLNFINISEYLITLCMHYVCSAQASINFQLRVEDVILLHTTNVSVYVVERWW